MLLAGEVPLSRIARCMDSVSCEHLEAVDVNLDGNISRTEFIAAMLTQVNEDGLRAVFQEIDSDGNGKLDKDELLYALTRYE